MSENLSLNCPKFRKLGKNETPQISKEAANLVQRKNSTPGNRELFKLRNKFKKLKILDKQLSLEKNSHKSVSNSSQKNHFRYLKHPKQLIPRTIKSSRFTNSPENNGSIRSNLLKTTKNDVWKKMGGFKRKIRVDNTKLRIKNFSLDRFE